MFCDIKIQANDTAEKAKAAYEEAGYECKTLNEGRDQAHTPYITETNARPQWCSFFGSFKHDGNGKFICDGFVDDRRRLYWCDSFVQSGNLAGSSQVQSYVEVPHKLFMDQGDATSNSGDEGEANDYLRRESSHENSSSAQHIKLNQWKLLPKLDVQWPKGHNSLWELISNEVADHVEEVGTSVLSAL